MHLMSDWNFIRIVDIKIFLSLLDGVIMRS